jgi:hypothetical protein
VVRTGMRPAESGRTKIMHEVAPLNGTECGHIRLILLHG